MSNPTATLVVIALGLGLIPLGAWIIRSAKRSTRAMAPMAGLLMLLGAFLTSDAPPPPKAESTFRDEADEDGAADPDKTTA